MPLAVAWATAADFEEMDRCLALKARDAGEAVKAMRIHLARVSDHLNATDPAAGSWQ
jgi:DNA-binding GntR family transcriptional regulator